MSIAPRVAIAIGIGVAFGIATHNLFGGLLLGIGLGVMVTWTIFKQKKSRRTKD